MAHIILPRTPLALSDDAGFECIVTGIPLLCTGILSMGFFTFLLGMKRTTFLSVLLFSSCFFGFIAAIIDLGQILIRGHANVTNGLQLKQVTGYIRAREVFLSISVGFLFLFYWSFAGRRPLSRETEARMDMKGVLIQFGTTKTTHCASWERWGYVGIGLKWGSLAACLLIVTLEVVWRLAPKHHIYGDLYVASATLETAISAIFILKLLLNFYLTPSPFKRQVLTNYIVPIVAFVINAGLGIGNLVVFAFSETSLGRFLRGIEVYLLIVHYLIITFRVPNATHTPIPPPPVAVIPRDQEKQIFTNQPIVRPAFPTSDVDVGQQTEAVSSNGIWKISRFSNLSKISSWIPSNRNSRRSLAREQLSQFQSWEGRFSPPQRSLLFMSNTAPEIGPVQRMQDTRYPQEVGGNGPMPPVVVSLNGDDPLNDLTFSYYGVDRTNDQDTSSVGTMSPIYGLNGITMPTKTKASYSVVRPPNSTKGDTSGDITPNRMTRLAQEQSEIDKSIAVLRNQIDRGSGNVNRELSVGASDLATSKSTPTYATLNSSKLSSPAQSDFSLSVFPVPPAPPPTQSNFRELPAPPAAATLRPTIKRVPPAGMIPIQIDLSPEPGNPANIDRSPRSASAATQYDVTSFIGDLSAPQNGYLPFSGVITSSGVFPASGIGSDSQSVADRDRDNAGDRTPTGNTLMRTPSRPLGSATMSSGFPKPIQSASIDRVIQLPPQSMALRTLLAKNTSIRTTPMGPRHSRSNSLINAAREQSDPARL